MTAEVKEGNEGEKHTTGAEGGDFDTILTHMGTGKWHAFCYITIAYWITVLPYHTLAGAFLSPPVDHTCRPPANTLPPTLILPTDFDQNVTTYNTSATLPYDSSCMYLLEDPATGRLEEHPCHEWDFDSSTFSRTVTSEFALVCGRRYLRPAHQSIYMGGMLVGACFNGFLADRYGRWTMIAISTVSYTVLALSSAWLPSIGLLLTARFLLGTMHPTSLMTGYILVMEMTEMKKRSMMGTLTLGMWSLGTAMWGLWAYLERDWRWLQTYVSLFCIVFLPAILFLKESPRWLVVRGRHQEALKIVQMTARINNTTLPPTKELLTIMKTVEQQSASNEANVVDREKIPLRRRVIDQATILIRTRKLCIITVVMCISYFVVAMVFFGLTLGASAMDVDPFSFMGISGSMEIPSVFLVIFSVAYFGRKVSSIGYFSLCAISLLIQPLIPGTLKWLSVTLVMIGKFASSCAFSVLFLYSSELYPTEIRTQGMSAGMMASRVGGFVSPFIMSALEVSQPWAISVVFGLAAAVAAVSFFPLWETANICLPDTVAQLEGTPDPPTDTSKLNGVQDSSNDKVTAC